MPACESCAIHQDIAASAGRTDGRSQVDPVVVFFPECGSKAVPKRAITNLRLRTGLVVNHARSCGLQARSSVLMPAAPGPPSEYIQTCTLTISHPLRARASPLSPWTRLRLTRREPRGAKLFRQGSSLASFIHCTSNHALWRVDPMRASPPLSEAHANATSSSMVASSRNNIVIRPFLSTP